MAKKRGFGWPVLIGVALALVAVLVYAFWPQPVLVDMGKVRRAAMAVTVDESAKTRVRDAYVVSAPIAGRLQRVTVEPGDRVIGGETVIARMMPLNPSALDVRSREQALAAVQVAEASLRVAEADMNKAEADRELAELDLLRTRQLRQSGTVAQVALDRAERVWRAASAALDTARAAISIRRANLAQARAELIDFTDDAGAAVSGAGAGKAAGNGRDIPLQAPVSGRILQVLQVSETTLAAGTPILEIGNIANDLEVVVELLSTDAVQVRPGQKVLVREWGGDTALEGVVERVEPWGFTKFSALGVEEQRVRSVIRFVTPFADRTSLGHGYRVEISIVTWRADNVLTVPASALFRHGEGWAAYRVKNGVATLAPVQLGRRNDRVAHVLDGLVTDDRIILYPGPAVTDGKSVRQRITE